MNAPSLLRRLFDRMARPEPQQRLGACLALWRCSRLPFEEPQKQLMSDYLLEALRRSLQALVLSDGASSFCAPACSSTACRDRLRASSR